MPRYYSIVIIRDGISSLEDILIDYDDNYTRVYNIFNNVSKMCQNKNIFSDDVTSIVLRRTIIEDNDIEVKDIITITKTNNWKRTI